MFWEIRLFENIINVLKILNSGEDITNELEALTDALTYLQMEIERTKNEHS